MKVCCLTAVWELDELRLKNHFRAIAQTSVPTFVVELSMGGPFQLPKAALRVSAKGRFWRKEQLLNLLAKQVPPEFTHFIWNDSGVALSESKLESLLIRALEQKSTFVQPFTTCEWIGPGGGVEVRFGAHVAMTGIAHSGFAWATKRSTWELLGGLWDKDIFASNELDYVMRRDCKDPEVNAWLAPIPDFSLGCIPGVARHYWHKIVKYTSFDENAEAEARLSFDRTKDLVPNAQGVYELTNQPLLTYVSQRMGKVYA